MAYRLTPQARREQDSALEYQLRNWGGRATREFSSALAAVYDLIGGPSVPGSTREQWADRKYRWVRVDKYPYFVVWAYGTSEMDRTIVRILHVRRDLEVLMEETEGWS